MNTKRLVMKCVPVMAATATVGILWAGVVSAASELYDNTLATCTAANCSSLVIPGSVLTPGGRAGNFAVNLLAGMNECIRIETTSQTQDLEMVVVSPSGEVYINDDKGGSACPLCSLVKVKHTTLAGWYLVRLAHYSGAAVNADFVLRYGRYNLNNPNCNSPTAPRSGFDVEYDDFKVDSGVMESLP